MSKRDKQKHADWLREWRIVNPERAHFHQQNSYYKTKYGITLDERNALIAKGCEACGAKTGKLCIDHKKGTKAVRGCLCNNCNRALGNLLESAKNTIGIYNYIINKCE